MLFNLAHQVCVLNLSLCHTRPAQNLNLIFRVSQKVAGTVQVSSIVTNKQVQIKNERRMSRPVDL